MPHPDTIRLANLLNSIDNLEDFIKLSGLDGKIDQQTANEILRLIKEAKTQTLQ